MTRSFLSRQVCLTAESRRMKATHLRDGADGEVAAGRISQSADRDIALAVPGRIAESHFRDTKRRANGPELSP
jgi:hypothetical protein